MTTFAATLRADSTATLATTSATALAGPAALLAALARPSAFARITPTSATRTATRRTALAGASMRGMFARTGGTLPLALGGLRARWGGLG